MGKLHQPHDQFFKMLFSNTEVVRVFLQRFLPDDLSRDLDFSTLRITRNTFLTDEMSSRIADLVLECAFKKSDSPTLWISFLYEHKSGPDRFALLQIEEYLLKAYRKQMTERKEPLTMIVPILYYHGKKDWHPRNLRERMVHYFKDLRRFVPEFDYLFLNITQLTDQEIKDFENKFLVPGLLIQKYFKDLEQLQTHLADILYHLSLIEESGNFKTNYFVYLIDLFDEDKRTFMKRIETLEPPTRDKTKNFLLQMIEEGRKEGRDEGRDEQLYQVAKKMVIRGNSNEEICDLLEVEENYVNRIRQEVR